MFNNHVITKISCLNSHVEKVTMLPMKEITIMVASVDGPVPMTD